MNKIKLFSLCIMSILILSGCLQIPSGYTPSAVLHQNHENKKYAVTFSVDYLSDGDVSIGRASQEKYIDWLKEDLRKTNAFSSVSYKPFAQKSNYHIHFLMHYSCLPVNEAVALGFFMGYTFCTIPAQINMYLDMSAILYLNNTPVHSPATAEVLRCYVWLPFLPVGLVWNQWWAWTTQEKKCYRYLINSIIDFQLKAEKNPALLKTNRPKKQIAKPRQTPSPSKNTSSGTGFAVDKNTVITALHVVKNKKNIKVCFDGKNWLAANLVKQSEALDVAVLEASSHIKNFLPLTAKNKSYAGDRVFTFGYPYVQLLGSEIKYSEGAISSMSGVKGDQTLIQTTVPIHPGNSGSPLLNENGEVIGMLTSTAALPAFLRNTGTIPQNINWAVKAEYISTLTGSKQHTRNSNFKNRRDLIQAVRQATCQILAE